jgi:hypothetical protein
MKAASAALLLAHCAQVSCFFAPVPAAVPGAQRPRGAPSAVGGLLQARAVRSAAAVRVARPGALQLVAGLGDATSTRPQVLRDATRLTRAVWQSAAALLRSVIVQLAAVLSFLFMSPALAGAAPALDARGPAAIEAPAPDVAASRQARVVLVAQAAVPQATPQEHLAQAWKHTAAAASAAVGEVTSPIQTKFEETLRPLKDTMRPVWDGSFKPTWEGSVKPAWEGTIKPGAEKLAARASTLLHETVDSAKSLVDRVGDKGAAAQGHHDHAHHAGHDADTVYRTKGLSAIRAHGDAELAAHGASAPAATDAEVQARFPDWKVPRQTCVLSWAFLWEWWCGGRAGPLSRACRVLLS